MSQHREDYTSILVESFRSNEPGHRYPIEIRPVAGEVFPTHLLVECPMKMRKDYPVGTVFRIRAKLKDTPFDRAHLYTSYKWPFEVIGAPGKRDEVSAIRKLYRRLLRAPRSGFPNLGERLEVPDKHGVYIVFSPDGVVVHVGRTVRGKRGLRRRLSNHLHGNSSFARQFLGGRGADLRGTHAFAFLEVEDARTRTLLESFAIGSLCPKHLGVGENAA